MSRSTPMGPHHDDSSWDVAMRDAIQRESVETLRHQVALEREQQAKMQRSDALFALLLFGAAVGGAYTAKKLPSVPLPGRKRRSRA